MKIRPSIAYLIDPRFPGGTSSAVASELKVACQFGRVTVHAVSSKMFGNRNVALQITAALRSLGLDMVWDAPTVSSDIVILHNPSFLKFQDHLDTRIVTRHLIVVAHENFFRPGQQQAFDVSRCLNAIDVASLATQKSIAPISPYNRGTVTDWFAANGPVGTWSVLDEDWFNICDFPFVAPTSTPRDRRGRHSRPGMEKFPGLSEMDLCFSRNAETNIILGADLFLKDNLDRPHWQMIPFRGLAVAQYFEMIDFLVYFTAPTWRESFGRVLAEAVAAGKVVLTDPGTASVFEGAVVATSPANVDEIIAGFIADPARYRDQVETGQSLLKSFSPQAFQERFLSIVDQASEVAA